MATYYIRADGTAANKAAATSAAAANTSMNIWVHNTETFSPDDIIKISDAGGVYYVTSPQLTRLSGDTHIYTRAYFYYTIAGVTYNTVTSQQAINPASGNLPTTKYGAWSFDVGTTGTITSIAATDNTTGYADAASAIAGLPAVAGDKCRLGYITIYNTSGSDFVPGTTTLNATGITTTVVTNDAVRGFFPPSSGTDGHPIVYQADTGSSPIISGGIKLNPANWTETGTNGEYRNAVMGSAALPGSIVVRGAPTGVSTYIRLEQGTKDSLAEDTYSVNAVSGVRYVYYKPLAGHTPDEYDFEYCAINALYTTKDYLTFSGIEFICGVHSSNYYTSYSSAVYVTGTKNIFNSCTVKFGGMWGLAFTGSYCEANDCTISWCAGTGLYFSGTGATYGIAHGNTVNYIGTIKADIYGDRGGIGIQADNCTVSNNLIHNIAWATGMTDFTYQNGGIQCTAGHMTAKNNFLHTLAQNGIAGAGDATGHHNTIYNNIIKNWGLNGAGGTLNNLGIKIYGVGDTADSGCQTVYNNTLYNDQNIVVIGINCIMSAAGDYVKDSTFKNNLILFENAHADSAGFRFNRGNLSNCSINYNLVYGCTNLYYYNASNYTSPEDFYDVTTYGQYDISFDPLLVNAGGSTAADYKPDTGSPAIGAGVQVGATPMLDYEEKGMYNESGGVTIGAYRGWSTGSIQLPGE